MWDRMPDRMSEYICPIECDIEGQIECQIEGQKLQTYFITVILQFKSYVRIYARIISKGGDHSK